MAAHVVAAPHSQYQVIDLGTLTAGGYPVVPYDVNGVNQTVGTAVGVNRHHRAFVHELGVMRDLGAGTNGSFAGGINERGDIIGTFSTDWDTITQGRDHSFVYSGGVITDLSVQFNRFIRPFGLNEQGDMVGFAETDDRSAIVSFVLRDGDLALVPSPLIAYMDINDRGEIAGYVANSSTSPTEPVTHPAIFNQGATRLLPLPRGITSAIAVRINNQGTVIGHTTPPGEASQGFIFADGNTRLVKPLPGDFASTLNDVNNENVAVGQSRVPDERSRAIVWRNGSAKDLNMLIPRGSGWQLAVAHGINDRGVIVGSGLYDGEYHGFMLLPSADRGKPARRR